MRKELSHYRFLNCRLVNIQPDRCYFSTDLEKLVLYKLLSGDILLKIVYFRNSGNNSLLSKYEATEEKSQKTVFNGSNKFI